MNMNIKTDINTDISSGINADINTDIKTDKSNVIDADTNTGINNDNKKDASICGNELKRSLNLVIIAITMGMAFFTVMGGAPLAGFSRALGAGDFLYSLIMAMTVIGGIVQIVASYFLENTGKRKFIFMAFGFIHRLLWIPVALIPLIVPESSGSFRIWLIIVLIAISSVSNSVAAVSFSSWMGSLVPMDIRGRFFSKRAMISTVTSAVTALAAGKFLDFVPGFKGYAIVFIVVAILGVGDIICFKWVYDPPMRVPEKKTPFLKLSLEPLRNKNYMLFICYIAFWSFGVNIAGPFFIVYMLENLKMSFFIISLFTQFTANISTIIFIRYWGKIIDRYGNKPVMAICCSIIISLPFLWLFVTPSNYFIILAINFIGGMLWPGYELTAMNLSIWLAPEKNRSIYLAVNTLIISFFGIAVAYICGGAFKQLADQVLSSGNAPFIFGRRLNSFHLLFACSGILRLLSMVLFFRKFREERSNGVNQIVNDFKNSLKAAVFK